MMTIYGLLIATAILGQVQVDQQATGEVVDNQGKPVANAEVVLYAPPTDYGKGTSVEVQATDDCARQVQPESFHDSGGLSRTAFTFSPTGPAGRSRRSRMPAAVSFGPGKAQAHERSWSKTGTANRLPVLCKSAGCCELSSGPPKCPRHWPNRWRPHRPGRQGDGQYPGGARSTGGRASHGRRDRHAGHLADRTARPRSEESVITIKLKPTSYFAGRIVDQVGQPVAGQLVEVWSRG